jgi:RNA polymerase sigma-70 factor (sigma-E family)
MSREPNLHVEALALQMEPVQITHDAVPMVRLVVLDEILDPEEVYRRAYRSLVRTAYLLVDKREVAEEIVQDAFAKAFPKWGRLREPEAYLRTCVVNGCRRLHRRRRLIARTARPAPIAQQPDEGDHIADLVRSLPSRQREVVVLRYYLQATDQEIADTLRIPVGTVKSTLNRARARLREELT